MLRRKFSSELGLFVHVMRPKRMQRWKPATQSVSSAENYLIQRVAEAPPHHFSAVNVVLPGGRRTEMNRLGPAWSELLHHIKRVLAVRIEHTLAEGSSFAEATANAVIDLRDEDLEDIAEVSAPYGESACLLAWSLLGTSVSGDPEELMISVMKSATVTMLEAFESYLVDEVALVSTTATSIHDRRIAI